MNTRPTLLYEAFSEENLMVLIHTSQTPDDGEWRVFIEALATLDLDRCRVLVVTAGGAPTATQRAALLEITDEKSIPSAIVTADILPRMAIRALGWFNKSIRAFHPSAAEAAFDFLALPPLLHDPVKGSVDALQRELGVEVIQGLQSAS